MSIATVLYFEAASACCCFELGMASVSSTQLPIVCIVLQQVTWLVTQVQWRNVSTTERAPEGTTKPDITKGF
jgi:hypothetical protein